MHFFENNNLSIIVFKKVHIMGFMGQDKLLRIKAFDAFLEVINEHWHQLKN
jgi:hypothetical protein